MQRRVPSLSPLLATHLRRGKHRSSPRNRAQSPSDGPELGDLRDALGGDSDSVDQVNDLTRQLEAATKERDDAKSAKQLLAQEVAALQKQLDEANAPRPQPQARRRGAKPAGEIAQLRRELSELRATEKDAVVKLRSEQTRRGIAESKLERELLGQERDRRSPRERGTNAASFEASVAQEQRAVERKITALQTELGNARAKVEALEEKCVTQERELVGLRGRAAGRSKQAAGALVQLQQLCSRRAVTRSRARSSSSARWCPRPTSRSRPPPPRARSSTRCTSARETRAT